MLSINNIHTYYGNIHALKGISLEVEDGEIVTLIGANGAGKSTTLMSISGIHPPRRGTVTFQGEEITKKPPDAIVRLGICQVPEGRRIFPLLTVSENLLMGSYARRDSEVVKEDLERVYELFPVLKERRLQDGGTLSGGEQQMLAIARALMAKPRLLLLDEPSLGLAPLFVEKIFRVIGEIKEQGTTILLVEQNAFMALNIADRGYVIETGRVVLEDTAKNLLDNPRVKEAYLGE
jgi:branched-chain amino acid transport system ATP-binding protein